MALGTIGTALVTSAITAGANVAASRLSKRNKGGGFQAPGINAGGLQARFGPGGVNVGSSPFRQGLVGNVSATFPEQANLTRGLRDQVTPGFGALTQSRLSGIENRRTAALGNLRENLQRRRVLGSSFAGDAVTRSDLAFEQEADRVRAESFLQELDLTNRLTQQEFNTRRQEFTTQLDELNLQANLAGQLARGATGALASNAQLKERLAAQEAQAAGAFFGRQIEPISRAVGQRVGGGGTGAQIGTASQQRI